MMGVDGRCAVCLDTGFYYDNFEVRKPCNSCDRGKVLDTDNPKDDDGQRAGS